MSIVVNVRYFAAAEAALGRSEDALSVTSPTTIEDVLRHINDTVDEKSLSERVRTVLSRCSFIVNGRSTRDVATSLSNGDQLDVLPPFAGG